MCGSGESQARQGRRWLCCRWLAGRVLRGVAGQPRGQRLDVEDCTKTVGQDKAMCCARDGLCHGIYRVSDTRFFGRGK